MIYGNFLRLLLNSNNIVAIILSLCCFVFLASCSYVGDGEQMASGSGTIEADGESGDISDTDSVAGASEDYRRISLIPESKVIEPDGSLSPDMVVIPAASVFDSWGHVGGNPNNHIDNIKLSMFDSLRDVVRAKVGFGEEWETPPIPSPVVSEKAVFSLDAKGVITAHSVGDIEDILWRYHCSRTDDVMSGGGLAYSDGVLAATSAGGVLTVLDADSGKLLWRKNLFVPLRSAPRIFRDMVFVISANSQTFAFDARKGYLLWNHRGIQESTSIFSSVSPAIYGNIVVSLYPSGEIFGFNRSNGAVLWSESLLKPNRVSASDIFSGAGGNPIVAGGRVFAVSNNGMLASFAVHNGMRVWELPISSSITPWLSGRVLYVVSDDGGGGGEHIYAINAEDGRVIWVKSKSELLEHAGQHLVSGGIFKTIFIGDDDYSSLKIRAIYMVDDLLLLTMYDTDEESNIWLRVNPRNGDAMGYSKIIDDDEPISGLGFRQNHLYTVSRSAELYDIIFRLPAE